MTGTVVETTSRLAGDVIVTESKLLGASGTVTTVVQLGGTVGGIGMSFSHLPAPLHTGDYVTVDVRDAGARGVALVGVRPSVSRAAAGEPGTAAYGVQRTEIGKVPLWRDSGCIDVIYDATTISEANAHVLDAAFAAWTAATTTCGELSFLGVRATAAPGGKDDISTVQIRTDRWCRPATASEPELCYPPGAAAVTRLVYVDSPGDADDGKILAAHMDLDAVNFMLLAPGERPPATTTKPALDLQSVTTHEAGHVIGLSHNCATGLESWPMDLAGNRVPACAGLAADSTLLAATMYYRIGPGDLGARSPEPSDTVGACTIVRNLTCERYIAGGCAASGGSASTGPLGLLGLLAVLVLTRRRPDRRAERAASRR